MMRRAFLSLLLSAAVFLALPLALAGCQDLGTTDVTPTYEQTTVTDTTLQTGASVEPPATTTSTAKTPTTAKATTTTVKLVGQLQTQITLELAPFVTRYEDSDPLMKWSGSWLVGSYQSASGGSYHQSTKDADSVLIKFQGTRISFVTVRESTAGIAKLTLDGVVYLVDTYGPKRITATVWSSPVLANGTHQLRIETSGSKNPAALWTYIGVDAVDVVGKLVP